jgi:hypothetical protein
MLQVLSVFVKLVFALSVIPALMPPGRWFSRSVGAFLVAEAILFAFALYDLSGSNDDGPGLIGAFFIVIAPALIFAVALLLHLVISSLIWTEAPAVVQVKKPAPHIDDE